MTRTRDEYIADPKEDRGVWIMYGLARLGRNGRGTLSLQRPCLENRFFIRKTQGLKLLIGGNQLIHRERWNLCLD